MHHDPDQIWTVAKAIGIGAVTGVSIIGAAVFAQVEKIVPSATSDSSISFILATGMVALLSSVVYIFRENIARAHNLEMEKQLTERERVKHEAATEQKRMQLEAEKSREERESRHEREERSMNLIMQLSHHLSEANAEIEKMLEKNIFMAERSAPIDGDHQSLTDSSTRKKFVSPQDNHNS